MENDPIIRFNSDGSNKRICVVFTDTIFQGFLSQLHADLRAPNALLIAANSVCQYFATPMAGKSK
jgi:hypothetical protein